MYVSGGYANFQATVGFNNYGVAAAFMRIRDLSQPNPTVDYKMALDIFPTLCVSNRRCNLGYRLWSFYNLQLQGLFGLPLY